MKIVTEIPNQQYNNIMSIDSISLGRIPYKGIVMAAINAIKRGTPPPKGQEPRWIPVSERLPKNRGFYLVSTTDCITIMEFISGWISQNIGLCNGYVKAWMPLPQPYKAESEAADGNNYI
ncbi:MAG: hypothetical protein J6S67_10165 [Methanobrevibacter sp.]|nr:hypothetical protein [Methanobrevibacter sp.]